MRAFFYICISGFTQTRGTFHGILKLREELLVAGHSSGTCSRVWYLPWTSDWGQVASDLSIVCNRYGFKPLVLIAGYSYGGWGAIQLAIALMKVGIDVQDMILSDAVARPWYWPRPLPALTSMLGRSWSFPMQIPPNVIRLHEYYQQEDRPQGHRLLFGEETALQTSVKLWKIGGHQEMDDVLEFHECVLKQAKLMQDFGSS